MPPIIDAIFGNLSLFISILGAVSLGLGFQIFKGINKEEDRKNNLLNLLYSRQTEKILILIDKEIGSYLLAGDHESVVTLGPPRKHHVKELLSDLWEDALIARKFEDNWNRWSRWERWGQNTCAMGFFLNILFLLVIIFGLQNYLSNQTLWLVISAIAFGIPFFFALICWIFLSKYKSDVFAILEAPALGVPSRRFGDA